MRSYTELKIETDAGCMSAIEWQSDNEDSDLVVIALHGWLDNAASFIPIANHLKECRFIAFDLPGHGYTDHLPQPNFYNIHDYVHWLTKAVDKLALNKFVVIGHSLGAIVSSAWALHDSRISKLIWLDAVGGLSRPSKDSAIALRDAMSALTNFRPGKPSYEHFEDAVEARQKGTLKVSQRAAVLLCSRGLKHLENGRWTWRNDKALMLPSPIRLDEAGVENLLSAIKQPVLSIIASNGWPASDPEMLKSRLNQINLVENIQIDGGHHFHMEESIEKIVSLIKKNILDLS